MARPDVLFTVEDYRALPETGPRYQLIEGDLVVTPARTTRHQRISRNLEMQLVEHSARTRVGEVVDAPFDVYLSETEVVQPDLVLVLEAHRHRIGVDGLHGPADG